MSIAIDDVLAACSLDDGTFISKNHPYLNVWLQSRNGKIRVSIGYEGSLPIKLQSSRGYKVFHDYLQERRMNYLVFDEMDVALRNAFASMVVAAWNTSADAESPESSLIVFLATIRNLRELFSSGRVKFTGEFLRGVTAELLTVREFILQGCDATSVVHAWKAPQGSVRDFVFSTTHSVEVKSTRSDSGTIVISSSAQLDLDDGQSLQLVVWPLADSGLGEPTAFVLSDLIAEIRGLCRRDEAARLAFDLALDHLQLSGEEATLAGIGFTVGKKRVLDIKPTFPRLKAADIPPEVNDLTYTLRVADLNEFAAELHIP